MYIGHTMDINEIIESIAANQLGIETLETRQADSLDFHEVAVWEVREALKQAVLAGAKQEAIQRAKQKI